MLELLEKATVVLSATSYPTIADVRFLIMEIQEHLQFYINKDDFSQSMIASSINQKIGEYWNIVDSATRIAAILDPRTKLALFESGQQTTNALNDLQAVMNNYHLFLSPSSTQTTIDNTKVTICDWFNYAKHHHINATSSNNNEMATNSSITSELDHYIALPCDENVIPLIWWQGH